MCELRTTNRPQKKYTEPKGPFAPKCNHTYDSERLSNNGTLDTFLHIVRVKLLNTIKHKQDKQDNLTRKERLTLSQLINNPRIVINKADKGSTIVVEDRDEYISNAMVHLNNLNIYEPLHIDISPTLKELITEKLKALKNKGLLKQAWFEFCKPPKQTCTSRLYFLKKFTRISWE